LTSYDINARVNQNYFWRQKCQSMNDKEVFVYRSDLTLKEKYRLMKSTWSGDECMCLGRGAYATLKMTNWKFEKVATIEFWFAGSVRLSVNGSDAMASLDSNNLWRHCAIALNAKGTTVYLNGKVHSTKPRVHAIPVLYLISGVSDTGYIADMKVFNYARTLSEIMYYKTRSTPTDHPGLIFNLICVDGKPYDVLSGFVTGLDQNNQYPILPNNSPLMMNNFGLLQYVQGELNVIKMNDEFDNFNFLKETNTKEEYSWDSDNE
jgi:hypothetical protein